jgi:cystathionine beta-lyase/cystathionine gamma-synthase
MPRKIDDICASPSEQPNLNTRPAISPIHLAAVYGCQSPDEAARMLSGEIDGYVYQRDRHPNADQLAEKCRQLHAAERAMVFASGMSAMSAVLLARLRQGDHVLLSDRLYGKTTYLIGEEAARLGITSTVTDALDLAQVDKSIRDNTRLLIVETISNPTLRVADIRGLVAVCRDRNVEVLVDNTFATPLLCQPHELGADWTLESMSKMMNGHSDVIMGLLTGREEHWDRVIAVASAWGLGSAPFESWLALRGLATMHLRVSRACETALEVARFLSSQLAVRQVDYPGLGNHPDHELAKEQFAGVFGTMVTFHLKDDSIQSAHRFIQSCDDIHFCPSLGDIATTLSHPRSTSHRSPSAAICQSLGIYDGTIRLSLGVEATETVLASLDEGLRRYM